MRHILQAQESTNTEDQNEEHQGHHIEISVAIVPLREEISNIGLSGHNFTVIEGNECVVIAELSHIQPFQRIMQRIDVLYPSRRISSYKIKYF